MTHFIPEIEAPQRSKMQRTRKCDTPLDHILSFYSSIPLHLYSFHIFESFRSKKNHILFLEMSTLEEALRKRREKESGKVATDFLQQLAILL